jgi:hypothetical protein
MNTASTLVGSILLAIRSGRAIHLAGVTTLTLSTLLLWACASSQLEAHGPSDAPVPGGALVTVENQHVQDMRIYLVRGSVPIALGSVGTMEQRTFAVPTVVLGHSGTIRLMADPLGSRATFTSDYIPATPGDHVRWTLAPRLGLSHFSVRRVVGGS